MNNTKIELTPLNHVVFVVDASGSMQPYRDTLPEIFDRQIKTLAEQSVKLNQETRVSIYVFQGSDIRCIAYDRDVLRLPSFKGHYNPDNGTPLVRATNQALLDLSQTPELHADHAFLVYVLTDGEDTGHDRSQHSLLLERLSKLKDNWTVAALVPDQKGAAICKSLGFPVGNIQIWDVSEKGLKDAGSAMTQATQSYMTLRAQGVRSTKSLFTPSQTGNRTEMLKSLSVVTDPYVVYQANPATPKEAIQSFVERASGKPYVVGAGYYELIKPETVQATKKICLRTKPDGRLYSGTHDQVCKALGLPTGGDLKVGPAQLKDFEIFVQSTSVNRHVIGGQKVLVVKL